LESEREKKMQEARKEQSSLPSSLTCHNVRTGWLLAGAGFVFPSGLVGSFFLLLLVKQNRGLAAEHWWWWLEFWTACPFCRSSYERAEERGEAGGFSFASPVGKG